MRPEGDQFEFSAFPVPLRPGGGPVLSEVAIEARIVGSDDCRGKLAEGWEVFDTLMRKHGGLLSVTLAADLAGVARQRIHYLVDRSKLLSVRYGGRRFVSWFGLVRWLKEREAWRDEHWQSRRSPSSSRSEAVHCCKTEETACGALVTSRVSRMPSGLGIAEPDCPAGTVAAAGKKGVREL